MSNLKHEPRSNVVAFLDDSHEKTAGYRDCIKWLKESKISYAISHCPTIYELQVRNFWRSASYDVGVIPNTIKAEVHDKELMFSEADLARILRLQDDCGEEFVMSEEEVFEAFRSIGYEGPERGSKKEFKKSYLIKGWRYIAHVFIMCLDHRKGGSDGLNMDWAKAMITFCKGEKANIARLIFISLAENINAMRKNKWLLYPRFVQTIINDLITVVPTIGVGIIEG